MNPTSSYSLLFAIKFKIKTVKPVNINGIKYICKTMKTLTCCTFYQCGKLICMKIIL